MIYALIAFDLDGTLALSKSELDSEMAGLLSELLEKKFVAITSGGAFPQFEKQVISRLGPDTKFSNLYILCENGARLYQFRNNSWQALYAHLLTNREKEQITKALEHALKESGIEEPRKIFGQVIEDRGAQITFSSLGSEAPLELKNSWDPDHKKRELIVSFLKKDLPTFNIGIGGTTSIDITKEGVDKASGLTALLKHLNLNFDNMIYVGDALYPGGNDNVVLKLEIKTHSVSTVDETKDFIRELLKQ